MLTVSFKLSGSVAPIVVVVVVVVVGCCWLLLLLLVICLTILSLVLHPTDGLKTQVAAALNINGSFGRCAAELDISNIHEIAEPGKWILFHIKKNTFTLTCEHALHVKRRLTSP